MPKTKTTFSLVRNESGERKGKVDVWQADSRIGPAEQFEFRKLGDGSVAIYHNDTLLGDIDDRSKELIDWPMESDGDTKRGESPTNIRQRQHVKKIKEQHLTEFAQGMSLADVAEQFGFRPSNDGTFTRTIDETADGRPAVDVIEPLGGPGGAWMHKAGTDPMNSVRGRSPQELYDHLEFIASDYHDGRQLSLFLRRHLHLVENLDDELGAAVIRRMFDTRCDFSQALREISRQRPELWDRHREQQTILLID